MSMSLAQMLAEKNGQQPPAPQQSPVPVPQPAQVPAAAAAPVAPVGAPAQQFTQPPAPQFTPAPAAPSPVPAPVQAAQAVQPQAPAAPAAAPSRPRVDGLSQLKEETKKDLMQRIAGRISDTSLSEDQLQGIVRAELQAILDSSDGPPLAPDDKKRVINDLMSEIVGHGPLDPLLADDDISEIMVNGKDQVFVEYQGKLTLSSVRFDTEAQLRDVITRIVSKVGRRIDESSPYVDARLKDGSRVNAIIPPLAPGGSTLTIRKFRKDPLKVEDLIGFRSMTPEMATLLKKCVEGRLNILVSGGTGTGKTTMLNVLSSFIPSDERIITVEDAAELQLQQDHVVTLESRPANTEGAGEVTIRELIKNTLRMRPDRIVVGEVRSGEALDMLQAMNTGHDGSLSTIHANTPRDCISRLETLVLMAGMDLPLRAIREQIASAVDLVVQIQRLRDGTRRVVQLTEVIRMEGDQVTLQDLFKFDFDAGIGDDGKFLGIAVPTGTRPSFSDKLEDYGIHLPASLFGGHDMAGRF